MKRDKLVAKIDSTLEEYYSNGWDDGWSDGYDSGAEAHKEMIRTRLNMYLDTCMNTNKIREAQFTKEMLKYLMWEYDPSKVVEDEETYGLIL